MVNDTSCMSKDKAGVTTGSPATTKKGDIRKLNYELK